MYNTIGTCSICGGAVTTPMHWGGLFPPIPTCKDCGAIAQPNYGAVIPMQPRPQRYDQAPNMWGMGTTIKPKMF